MVGVDGLPSAVSVFQTAVTQAAGSATSPVQARLTALTAQSSQLATSVQQTQAQVDAYNGVLNNLLTQLATQLDVQA